MPYGDSSVVLTAPSWPQTAPRRRVGGLALALATVLSFAAGVGSTLVYLQTFKDEIPMAALPLIEADRAPTRVRPEGFDAAGPRVAQSNSTGLPSPISSAMAAMPEPVVDLSPQGIPQALELVPPVAAAVIELAPPPDPAPVVVSAVVPEFASEPEASLQPQFQIQLASMRTPDGAREEISRLKRLHANLLGSIELTVQRIDQGARGVFYRVLSDAVGERPEAAELCSVIAQKRGQCAVIALRAPAPLPEPRPASVAKSADAPSPSVAKMPPAAVLVIAPSPPSEAVPVAAPAPVAPSVAAARPESAGSETRAQLGSMRSMEGATREVARLNRLYGSSLGPTELTVSRIDQGDRGVFYRILTAPLPSRDAASDLCQRLGASHHAGCVLIPSRPTA